MISLATSRRSQSLHQRAAPSLPTCYRLRHRQHRPGQRQSPALRGRSGNVAERGRNQLRASIPANGETGRMFCSQPRVLRRRLTDRPTRLASWATRSLLSCPSFSVIWSPEFPFPNRSSDPRWGKRSKSARFSPPTRIGHWRLKIFTATRFARRREAASPCCSIGMVTATAAQTFRTASITITYRRRPTGRRSKARVQAAATPAAVVRLHLRLLCIRLCRLNGVICDAR